jgi:hypothetical protein
MPATEIPRAQEEQSASRILAAGSMANEHSQQFNKILDLNYERGRDKVSLVESLGIREVTSKSGQLGMPIAANSQ